jgi:hypothetical protein
MLYITLILVSCLSEKLTDDSFNSDEESCLIGAHRSARQFIVYLVADILQCVLKLTERIPVEGGKILFLEVDSDRIF